MFRIQQQATIKLTAVWALMVLLMGAYFLLVRPALAQNNSGYDTTGKNGLVQCGNKTNDPCTVEDVFNIFVIATNLLIGAVGLVAILAIVYSGFSMVTAAGNTESIAKAKKNLTNAIIGLILVLLAFILVNLILYGLLGVTGNKEGVFNPLQYITGGGSGATPVNNTPPSNIKPPSNGP